MSRFLIPLTLALFTILLSPPAHADDDEEDVIYVYGTRNTSDADYVCYGDCFGGGWDGFDYGDGGWAGDGGGSPGQVEDPNEPGNLGDEDEDEDEDGADEETDTEETDCFIPPGGSWTAYTQELNRNDPGRARDGEAGASMGGMVLDLILWARGCFDEGEAA